MLRRVLRWLTGSDVHETFAAVDQRARNLLTTIRMIEKAMPAEHLHRVLISNYTIRFVCGTQDDVVKIAEELAVRTGFCVEILVVVGLVHKRSCPDCPPAGELPYTTVGN